MFAQYLQPISTQFTATERRSRTSQFTIIAAHVFHGKQHAIYVTSHMWAIEIFYVLCSHDLEERAKPTLTVYCKT
jgi:hypothetical protein